MKEIEKIVALLEDGALERKVAAAIVLGELGAKGPEVVRGLVGLLGSNIPVLERHALDALAKIGAKKALPAVLGLVASPTAEVREAARRCAASVGEEALPILKERMATAGPDERRGLDAILAEIGGRDAWTELLRGLTSGDAEASKASALAVRQQVKGADQKQKKAYATATLKFLGDLEKEKKGQPAPSTAIGATLKILGFLEDERAVPTLLAHASDPNGVPAVRMEAVLALRFTLKEASEDITVALVSAAESADRTLSQAALVTLGSLVLDKAAVRRMTPLVLSPDPDRAAFAVEHLARQKGPEATQILAKALVSKDKRVADAAAAALGQREDAAPTLAKTLLETESADRAWAIRNVLRPLAKKIPPALRKELLAAALERVQDHDRGFEAYLDVAREADPDAVAEGLRELVQKAKRSKDPNRCFPILSLLCRSERATHEDRFALALLELKKSTKDPAMGARANDDALIRLRKLMNDGFDVGAGLKKDKTLELEDLYYVGFHFTETRHPLGEELLGIVAERGGRAKIGKMAKNKLKLAAPS